MYFINILLEPRLSYFTNIILSLVRHPKLVEAIGGYYDKKYNLFSPLFASSHFLLIVVKILIFIHQ
jgi:hypothetical protein